MAKDVDEPFAWVSAIFLIIFFIEQTARSIAQYVPGRARGRQVTCTIAPSPAGCTSCGRFTEYCFSFFWFMELVANLSMVLSLAPLLTLGHSDDCVRVGEANHLRSLSFFSAGVRA